MELAAPGYYTLLTAAVSNEGEAEAISMKSQCYLFFRLINRTIKVSSRVFN